VKRVFVCAGRTEVFEFAKSVGVGMVEAALGVAEILRESKFDEVVFVGTCGLYDKRDELLKIYEVFKVENLEMSGVLSLAYSPLFEMTEKIKSVIKTPNVSRETFNSSNFITTDAKTAQKFSSFFVGENMELYGVKVACERAGVAWRGILCATNYCDQNAHKNYVKNIKEAKKRLEKYIERLK